MSAHLKTNWACSVSAVNILLWGGGICYFTTFSHSTTNSKWRVSCVFDFLTWNFDNGEHTFVTLTYIHDSSCQSSNRIVEILSSKKFSINVHKNISSLTKEKYTEILAISVRFYPPVFLTQSSVKKHTPLLSFYWNVIATRKIFKSPWITQSSHFQEQLENTSYHRCSVKKKINRYGQET